MATIADLKVLLSARTASFVKGMGRGARSVSRLGRTATGTIRKIARLGAKISAVAGIGGATGVVLLLRNSAKQLDAIGKMADRLGATTEGLAFLQLQAKLSGVEVRTLTMAMQRLTRRIGGVGSSLSGVNKMAQEQAKFFKILKLNAKELIKLPAEEQFIAWMKALRGVADQATRVALAQKFVDSEGVAVLQMMNRLTTQLAAARMEFDKLGGGFTRLEIAGVEAMLDAFTKLFQKIDTFRQAVVVKLAPVITAAMSIITDALGDPQEQAGRLVAWIGEIGEKVLHVASFILPTLLRIGEVVLTIAQAFAEVIQAVAGFFKVETSLDRTIESFEKWRDKLDTIAGDLELQGQSFFDLVSQAFKKAAAEASSLLDIMNRVVNPIEDVAAAAAKSGRATFSLAKPSAFGGFRSGGGTRFSAISSGSVSLTIQRSQLTQLTQINKKLGKMSSGGLGGN